MGRTIVILGTLDTKGRLLHVLKSQIEARGHRGLLLDLSMGSPPAFAADISAAEVAGAAGRRIEDLNSIPDRSVCTGVMIEGAQRMVRELISNKQIDGIVAMGGTSMALIGSRVMARLPFGMPKVIATPAAMPAFISEWFGSYDIVIMQLTTEFSGTNHLVASAVALVAGAISGMVEETPDNALFVFPYPSVAVTQLGFCERCSKEVKRLLEERRYHVYPFHADGISDRNMERLMAKGFLDGLIDIVPAGTIEELFQGNRGAGDRLDVPLQRRMPIVLAPCTLNMTGAGPTRRLKEHYVHRQPRVQVDELRFMTRYTTDEMRQGARLYADKLNRAEGPVRFLVPLRGWSNMDRPGSVLYNPCEDRVFFEELRVNLTRQVPIETVDCNLEDPEFALALVNNFGKMFRQAGGVNNGATIN